jgi:hypothetical protein
MQYAHIRKTEKQRSKAMTYQPFKTIVITWNEYRAFLPSYGKPQAALWTAMGDDSDLNDALAYAAKENRQVACHGAVYQVHTFGINEPNWKAKAFAARANNSQA